MTISRRDCLNQLAQWPVAMAASSSLLASAMAQAQTSWPSKALRLVVPFTPGGTTDYVTRLVGIELAKALGQAVVVENKPGAGTVIGVDAVAKSIADGYSFVTVANSFAANQTLVKKLPYDTLKDLRPVALMGMSEHVLATHPGSGLKNSATSKRCQQQRPTKSATPPLAMAPRRICRVRHWRSKWA